MGTTFACLRYNQAQRSFLRLNSGCLWKSFTRNLLFKGEGFSSTCWMCASPAPRASTKDFRFKLRPHLEISTTSMPEDWSSLETCLYVSRQERTHHYVCRRSSLHTKAKLLLIREGGGHWWRCQSDLARSEDSARVPSLWELPICLLKRRGSGSSEYM